MKKIIISAAAMLLAVLTVFASGCKGTGKKENTTPANGDNTEAITTEAEDFTPSGKTYGGADFTVLVSGVGKITNDFVYNEDIATVLDDGIYKKNSRIEETYDIIIESIEDFGSGKSFELMNKAYISGSSEYHMAFVAAYDAVPLACANALYDLNSVPGLDLENPWWDQAANRDLDIEGVMFFTTGDISTIDDLQQFCTIFNKSLYAEKHSGTSLYDIVAQGAWTYDKLYDIGKDYCEDLDGNDVRDMKDKYGILTWDDTIYAVFSSSGGKIVSYDESAKALKLTILDSEAVINALTTYTEYTKEIGINYSRTSGTDAIKMFNESRALFFLCRIQSLSNFRDMNTDYGILPYPKYTESGDYLTTTSSYHVSFVCTLNNEDSIYMRGDIIEAMGYFSQKYLTPAYYEKTLVGTYVRDDESEGSLEILATTRIYDIGFYIQPANINKHLIYQYREWKTDFVSTFQSLLTAAQAAIDSTNGAYSNAVIDWGK